MLKKMFVFVILLVIMFSLPSITDEELIEDVVPDSVSVKARVFIDSGHGVNYDQGVYPLYPSQEVYSYLKEAGMLVYDKDKIAYNFQQGEFGEMSINWSVSTKLFELLQRDDRFEVQRDRNNENDEALSNVDRAIVANEWCADIRICIHAERASFRGYFLAMPHEDFYLPVELGGYYTKEIRDKSEAFAEILLDQLDQSELPYGRSFDNGYHRNKHGFIMYRFSKHPVVVLEMDGNTEWSDSIELDSVQNIIAQSIYNALDLYYKSYFRRSALYE